MKDQLNWAVSGLLVQTVFTQGGLDRKKNSVECEKELRSAARTQFNTHKHALKHTHSQTHWYSLTHDCKHMKTQEGIFSYWSFDENMSYSAVVHTCLCKKSMPMIGNNNNVQVNCCDLNSKQRENEGFPVQWRSYTNISGATFSLTSNKAV